MSDDRTQHSTGGSSGNDDPADKTRTSVQSKKVQVRMSSGKIYGPYGRDEIISFIHAKKLKGQEEILFDGETLWRPISSDVEFFDAFQDVLVGRSPRLDKIKTKIAAETKVLRPEENPEAGGITRTQLVKELTKVLADPSPATPAAPAPTPHEARTALLPTASPELPPPQVPAPKSPRKFSAKPLYFVMGLGILVAIFLLIPTPQKARDFSQLKDLKFQNRLLYSKSLQFMVEGLTVKIPALPAKIEKSDELDLPQGFGANIWAQDVIALSKLNDASVRQRAAYWARWAWNLQWLGEVLRLFDPPLGEHVRGAGFEMFAELDRRKVLSASQREIFLAVPAIFEGKWAVAQNKLQGIQESEMAQWLAELCSWMAFWERGGTGEVYRSPIGQYSSLNFDVPARIRRALVDRDPQILQYVQTLAVEDPLDFSLWFNLSEYAWRLSKDNIQLANRFFIIGLPTVALVPASFQKIYWSQFKDFLLVFGRKSSSDRVAHNVELLQGPGLADASDQQKKFLDLGQEALNFEAIAQDIMDRAQRDDLTALDMASLRAMAFVAPAGAKLLVEAGHYLAFDRYYSKAKVLFELATRLDKNLASAWGGLMWTEAGLYRFDKAQTALERMGTIKTELSESTKYRGLLQSFGREFENAEQSFKEYARSSPADAWGHYFRALLQEKMDNSLECAKSANLARIHAQGLLKKRALLLLYRCKILARLEVRATLEDLKKLRVQEPSSIPLALELIEGLMNADAMPEAQQSAEDAVVKFPRSYELRLKMGQVHERRRNYDLAVGFYNDAKKDRPDSAEASILIARIMEREGKLTEAAQNLETAARVDPAYPEVYLLAARTYEKLGRFPEAARLYTQEIEERPAVLSSFIEAAEFMLKINAPQEVPKIFQKFNEDYQGDARVLTRLAQAYFAMKDIDNARQTAALAFKQNPLNSEANRILAFIYDGQGQYEMAKRHFESYLQSLPQASDADEIRAKISVPPYVIR